MRPNPQTIFHSVLYGGASALLILDVFFLVKALFQNNFVPVLPILVGILLAGGLLLILYAEQAAREQDRKELQRLTRVAHQLENPLHTLQEDFQLLVRQKGKLPSEVRMKLTRMDTKTNILLENMRDVFLMLRSQHGRISQEVRTYDACTLVQEALKRADPLASAHNTDVTQKTHCDNAPIEVDKGLFLIALQHIIENGILYSLKPGMINITTIRGSSFVRIIVQDRGIGVKKKDEEAIFLPFARGMKADQFDPDGIGVGLTLAKSIIEEFKGTLTFRRRQKSMGSEFEIKLPLQKLSSRA